jgi:ADP-ribose pyrophosphatase YjhB (NUDIX family)
MPKVILTGGRVDKVRRSAGIACCSYKNGQPCILIAKRRITYAFIDFVHGRYQVENREYIVNLLSLMTVSERIVVASLDFANLWYTVWLYKPDDYGRNSSLFREHMTLQLYEHYPTLKAKYEEVTRDVERFYSLVERAGRISTGECTWTFPKGGVDYSSGESIICAAAREFKEESGIENFKLTPLRPITTTKNWSGKKYISTIYIGYEVSRDVCFSEVGPTVTTPRSENSSFGDTSEPSLETIEEYSFNGGFSGQIGFSGKIGFNRASLGVDSEGMVGSPDSLKNQAFSPPTLNALSSPDTTPVAYLTAPSVSPSTTPSASQLTSSPRSPIPSRVPGKSPPSSPHSSRGKGYSWRSESGDQCNYGRGYQSSRRSPKFSHGKNRHRRSNSVESEEYPSPSRYRTPQIKSRPRHMPDIPPLPDAQMGVCEKPRKRKNKKSVNDVNMGCNTKQIAEIETLKWANLDYIRQHTDEPFYNLCRVILKKFKRWRKKNMVI